MSRALCWLLAALLQASLGEKVTTNNLAVQFSDDDALSDAGIRNTIRERRERRAELTAPVLMPL